MHLKAGAVGLAPPSDVKSWDLKIFSGVRKSILTINDLKIEVFYFPLKDSKSTKNLQNFDTKADIVRRILKFWEPFKFSDYPVPDPESAVKFRKKKFF